jgi:exonuclease SbcC
MEPTQINLKNFTSYKDETVNLEGFDIAVAIGENGAGKSSLVTDSITWCLYGEGSKGGKRNLNDYVKRGEQECRVELQFKLGKDLYRVVRHRSSSKDKTLLEFFVQQSDLLGNTTWVPRSGKGIDETQEIIEKMLRMDYKTFTSSSLILQGKSDSFTNDMTDTKRKEVLASVLGLDIWDQLQEKVKKQLKDLNDKLTLLINKKAPLEARVDLGETAKISLEGAKVELAEVESELKQLREKVSEIDKKLAAEPTLTASLKENETTLQQKRNELGTITQETAIVNSKINRLNTILENKERVEKALEDEKILTPEITALEVEVGKKEILSAQLKDAHSALAMARQDKSKLEMDKNNYTSEVQKLNLLVNRKEEIIEACEQEDELSKEFQEHEQRFYEYLTLSEKQRTATANVTKWDYELQNIKVGLQTSIRSRQPMVETLNSVPCGDDLKASCKLLASARAAAEEIKDFTVQLETESQRENPYKKDFNELSLQLENTPYSQVNHDVCKKLLNEVKATSVLKPRLDAAESRKTELQKMLSEIENKLALIDIDALQIKYTEVYNTLASISEKENSLNSKRSALAAAQSITKLKSELDNAAAVLPELKETLFKASQKDNQLNDEICDIEKKITSIKKDIDNLLIFRLQGDKAKEQQNLLIDHDSELKKNIGRYEQTLADVAKDEKELAGIVIEEKDLRYKISLYEILDQACGKKSGVPALIIENAVPEIERLANDMLNRVTSGRMQLRLDTQVEGKSTGTMQEVLRITIMDSGLPGPYQTYSGAEKFKIDISLRIAISKFLAHRAGAEIKLLVIDEGFGSLDASGRQDILNVINTVRQDFSKVIIITHLEELKDAFPRRIEVTNGPEGSKVNVA